MNIEQTSRRAVLNVTHSVDPAGEVIDVQLEPLPDASREDVARAAYVLAARRHGPSLISDAAAQRIANSKAIAIRQVIELLDAADETIFVIERVQEAAERTSALQRLRDAACDLHGYLAMLDETSATAAALLAEHKSRAHALPKWRDR